MSLSYSSCHRGQTTTKWAIQQQRLSSERQHSLLRKQQSFIETGRAYNSCNPTNIEINHQISGNSLLVGKAKNTSQLQKHLSLDQVFNRSVSFSNGRRGSFTTRKSRNDNLESKILYSSDSRINASFKKGPAIGGRKFTNASASTKITTDSSPARKRTTQTTSNSVCKNISERYTSERMRNTTTLLSVLPPSTIESDAKVNINIVLAQTIRATTENENGGHSDLESLSECTDVLAINSSKAKAAPAKDKNPNKSTVLIPSQRAVQTQSITAVNTITPNSAAYRRAQFRLSRDQISSTTILSSSPSLTVKRRPPLIRAMSAPVRTVDESLKIMTANKRKQRHRNIISRNISCDKVSTENYDSKVLQSDFRSTNNCSVGNELPLNEDQNTERKLDRSRSVLAPDVITLVSLISSGESESEKEEMTAPRAASENSPKRRAPLLRKTGKSVSFQENDPRNYQMAIREFSQMLRRGSIAPLAARIRANRPPTAPPISVFLSNFENSKMSDNIVGTVPSGSKNPSGDVPMLENCGKEKEISHLQKTTFNRSPSTDCEYPDYVRSTKERECWKLFKKMTTKGISVKYDTILRGMLTPTEFRQLQKQRELEEAKARKAEEIQEVGQTINVERLAKVLLKQ